MQKGVKIEIDYYDGVREQYRVRSVVNTLDPRPGEVLTRVQAERLVRDVAHRGGSVTVREGKQ